MAKIVPIPLVLVLNMAFSVFAGDQLPQSEQGIKEQGTETTIFALLSKEFKCGSGIRNSYDIDKYHILNPHKYYCKIYNNHNGKIGKVNLLFKDKIPGAITGYVEPSGFSFKLDEKIEELFPCKKILFEYGKNDDNKYQIRKSNDGRLLMKIQKNREEFFVGFCKRIN